MPAMTTSNPVIPVPGQERSRFVKSHPLFMTRDPPIWREVSMTQFV